MAAAEGFWAERGGGGAFSFAGGGGGGFWEGGAEAVKLGLREDLVEVEAALGVSAGREGAARGLGSLSAAAAAFCLYLATGMTIVHIGDNSGYRL